eukprot:266100-Amphidinium_carterae.1
MGSVPTGIASATPTATGWDSWGPALEAEPVETRSLHIQPPPTEQNKAAQQANRSPTPPKVPGPD